MAHHKFSYTIKIGKKIEYMEPVSSPSILPVSYDGCSEQTKECIKVPLNELRFLLTLMNPEPDILWKTARNQLWDVWIWLEYEDMTRIIMGFSGFYPSANDLCNLLTDHFKLSATVVCHHPTTRSLDGSELLEASNHYIVKGFAKNWEIECQNFVYYYNRPLSINPYPNISRGDGRYYIVHPKVARAAYLVHAFGWKDEEVYQSTLLPKAICDDVR
ncbi:hypothetical protein DL96DRAFT_321278 [Flagelloscypha sp. PMI_526]|nr:hypothetical protein DL96DRAFT_321278 [Flagelloscypha sp. PMI_526]